MKTIKTLACALALTALLIPLSAAADDASSEVRIASLKVKERLHSIEQINVTAEKPRLDIEPESAAVAALLREAEALESIEAREARNPAED